MRTVFFEESNSNNDAGDMPCYDYDDGLICCWRASIAERIKLLFSGRVWVSVLGKHMPPMLLTVKKPLRRYKVAVDQSVKAISSNGIGEPAEGGTQE